MLGRYSILGSLALKLATFVSAKPIALNDNIQVVDRNVTISSGVETNPTAGVEVLDISVSIDANPVVDAIVSALADTSPGLVTTTIKVAAATETVFVTESVAGCGVGSATSGSPQSSPTILGQAPFSLAAVASSTTVSYAASTLLPAVHWDYPVNDIQNLAPSNSSNLYYSSNGVSDPSVQHLFGALSSNFTHNVVVLDHSSYVSNTSCSPSGINVTFTSTEAFEFASGSWTAASSEFVLVTYTDGCHGTSDQQRTFWLIDSIELLANSLSIIAHVETEIAIENALNDVDLQWGTYYPPGSNATNTTTFGSTSLSVSATSSGASSSPTSLQSSKGSTSGDTCGNTPSSMINGLPAANCGDANFDLDLDTAIGFLQFNSESADESSFAELLPGEVLNTAQLADLQASIPISRRAVSLTKRGWWSDFTDAVSNAATSVADAVSDVASQAVDAAKQLAEEAAAQAAQLAKDLTELDPSISASTDFNYGPAADADSPWGRAAEVYTTSTTADSGAGSADVTIYCVDCGVKGHVALAGQVKFNVIDGLHALNANLNANLQAGVNIGLVAHAQYSNSNTKSLIRKALPEVGVSVDGVFSVGVFLSVDAISTVDVSAAGQAIVGVTMSIPDFEARLDLFDQDNASKSGVSGLEPTFDKRFEATGKISASVQLALPIDFNCGFEVPALDLKRAISLVERPSLHGKLAVAASTDNVAPASDTCNNGIEYFANVQNDLQFDFLGIKTFDLNHYESPPLLQGCQKFAPTETSQSDLTIPSLYTNTTSKSESTASANTSPIGRRSTYMRRDNSTTSSSGDDEVIASDSEASFDNTDFSDEVDDPVSDDGATADGTEFQSDATQALRLSSDADSDDGATFTTLVDSQKNFQVAPAQDGNLYAVGYAGGSASDIGLFAGAKNLIFGDDQDRILLYYPGEMEAYNASRIRLASETMVPKTARVVTLLQSSASSGSSSTYLAATLEKDIFNLVLCNFGNGAASKVFLVSGQSGLDTLRNDPQMKYTITGAPVSDCAPLALVNGGNGVV